MFKLMNCSFRILLCLLTGASAVLSQPELRQSDSKISPYLEAASKKILEAYAVPGGYEVVYAKVSFQVDSSGNITNAKLLGIPVCVRTKQASALTNAALLKAVQNASPLSPPPKEMLVPAHLTAVFDGRDLKKTVSCTVQD